MAARWLDNLGDGLKYLGDGFLQLLYPKTCWLCGQNFDGPGATFCATCRHQLTHDPLPHCPRCANSVGPFVELANGCTRCRDNPFVFERAYRLGPYAGLLRETILKLKNWSDETLAEIVGEVWAEFLGSALADAQPDVVVVPVPLHWRREWRRGFNQSEVLARAVTDKLRLRHLPKALRRLRATPRQVSLTPAQRLENVKGAFQARPGADLTGKTVLLVDDVLTTGATLNEAAKAVRALKPRRILVAVLAAAEL